MDFSIQREARDEIALYREQALRASAFGNERLAAYWRLASDEAAFVDQQRTATALLKPQRTHSIDAIAFLTYWNQEGNYYLDHKLQKSEISYWAFHRNENREAGSAYRYWLAFAQAQASKDFDQEIQEVSQAAIHYESTLPDASRYAIRAVSLFKKAQALNNHDAFLNIVLTHRWVKAAYAAAHLANIHIHTASISPEKIAPYKHLWNELLELNQNALALRIEAAMATQIGNEDQAIEYSLAALAALNAVDDLWKKLTCKAEKLEFEDNQLPPQVKVYKKIIFYRTSASEALTIDKRLAEYWRKAAFSLENSIDATFYSLEAQEKKPEHPLLSWYWKVSANASKRASILFATCASIHAKVPSLSTFFLRYYTNYFQKKMKKQIPIKFLDKISFHIMEYFLSADDWGEKWKEGDPMAFNQTIKSPTITCWIYQTWSLLKKIGVNSTLSTEFSFEKNTGICITMSKLLNPLLRRKSINPHLFLVDILADKTPHPSVDLHLVENRNYTRYLPNSIYVPHWPQPFLKPRDPTRGTRFENVCFFGEIQNLAPELRSQKWHRRLYEELGLHFQIRGYHEWNNYTDVDCVIAIRSFSRSLHMNKPATKLYNAWLAGVPFIGGSDSAYAADGNPGIDYLVATSLKEVFKQLKQLQENPSLRAMLVQNGHQSGQAFTQEATLKYWKKLIEETIPVRAYQWQQRSKLERAGIFLIQRIICWIHDFYFKKKNSSSHYA
jgi:hypothetical protein